MTAQHPASILLCFASSRSPPSFLVPFSFLRNPLLRSSPPSSLLSSRLSLSLSSSLSRSRAPRPCSSDVNPPRANASFSPLDVTLFLRRRANVPYLSSFIIAFLGLPLLSFIKSRLARCPLARPVRRLRGLPSRRIGLPRVRVSRPFLFRHLLNPFILRRCVIFSAPYDRHRVATVCRSVFSFALSISLPRYISLIDFLSAISEASRAGEISGFRRRRRSSFFLSHVTPLAAVARRDSRSHVYKTTLFRCASSSIVNVFLLLYPSMPTPFSSFH